MKILNRFNKNSFLINEFINMNTNNITKRMPLISGINLKTYTDNKVNKENVHIYNPNKPTKFIGRKMNQFIDFHYKKKHTNFNWDQREKQLMNQRAFMATQNNLYIKMMMKWQIELLKRKRKKAKTKENFEKYVRYIYLIDSP